MFKRKIIGAPKLFILKKSVLLVCCVLFACTQDPAPVTHNGHKFHNKRSVKGFSKTDKGFIYTVKSGDNIGRIAKKFPSNVSDIVRVNKLKQPYKLNVGDILFIPAKYYTAEEGDTLEDIAKKSNTTSSKLMHINNLELNSSIKKGDKIYLSGNTGTGNDSKNFYVQKVNDGKGVKFIWPIKGKILSSFGPKENGLYNDGVNIETKIGTPIMAAANGVVAYVGDDLSAYGKLVIVRHSNGWLTAYAHNSSILVQRGQTVTIGEVIAYGGNTGNVQTPQLHFSIRDGKSLLDPIKFLN